MAATLGRKTKYDEPLSEPIRVLFTERQYQDLVKLFGASEISTAIREIILGERVLEGAQVIEVAPPLSTDKSFPLIGSAICGPWDDVVSSTSDVHILSEQTATELEARDGDVFVRAREESMEGAGILDGSLVLMRTLPRAPRRGEIWLLQIFDEEGGCKSTIKRVDKWSETPSDVRLLDGSDEEYSTGELTAPIVPVAIARGVIGALR